MCELAKHRRSTFRSTSYVPSHPFSVIHSDVWGPYTVPTVSGHRWFITLTDDHTRVCWVYLFRLKSDVRQIVKSFIAMVENQFNTKIKIFHTDNGTEYFNLHLGQFFSDQGIVHKSSCIDTPQQNGIAERKNRHILEVARALMFTTNVPIYLWGEAVLTAIHLINRMPSRVLNFQSPVSILTKSYPLSKLLSHLDRKVFGCTVFVHVPNHSRGKFDPREIKCVFVGYSATQKGFKCFDPSTKKFYVTMDATFHERHSFFDRPHLQGGNLSGQDLADTFTFDTTNLFSLDYDPFATFHDITDRVPNETIITKTNEESLPRIQAPELRVYSRRKHLPITTQTAPLHSPTPDPNSFPQVSDPVSHSTSTHMSIPCQSNETDLPIALRKGIRLCTKHPLAKYVSHSHLSSSFSAFTTKLSSVDIPKNTGSTNCS